MSGLLELSPATISMPFSPPFNAASRVARLNLLLGRAVPWHRMHEVSKIGLMSAAKSICRGAAEGNFDTSASAAQTDAEVKKVQSPKLKVPNRSVTVMILDLGL